MFLFIYLFIIVFPLPPVCFPFFSNPATTPQTDMSTDTIPALNGGVKMNGHTLALQMGMSTDTIPALKGEVKVNGHTLALQMDMFEA